MAATSRAVTSTAARRGTRGWRHRAGEPPSPPRCRASHDPSRAGVRFRLPNMGTPRPRRATRSVAGPGAVRCASGSLAPAFVLVGRHDPLHQRVPDNIALVEIYNADPLDALEAVDGVGQ